MKCIAYYPKSLPSATQHVVKTKSTWLGLNNTYYLWNQDGMVVVYNVDTQKRLQPYTEEYWQIVDFARVNGYNGD